MQLVKFVDPSSTQPRVGMLEGGVVQPMKAGVHLTEILEADEPAAYARGSLSGDTSIPLQFLRLLAPIDQHEVWGAGVTYQRSMEARIDESEQGGSFYDLVYRADRPELFFKATPHRVVGPGGGVRIRRDTNWCVPEPELALVISSKLRWVGCTIGNDMSARDIEGRNPLYLPQAKLYDACCAIGPSITLLESMPDPRNLSIALTIQRAGTAIVSDTTSTSRMARPFEDLIAWLGRDNTFPGGVVLLTGTGIVPADDFTLSPDDQISIQIDGIGTLTNWAFVGKEVD
jgi:2-dehydro-3-deoxy-D-arabinonate dehydratase